MKKTIPFALALFAWGCLLGACSDKAQKEEANSAYEAQQGICIQKYATKEYKTVAEMDACRAAVKTAWGRDAGAKDGAK